MTKKIKWGIIGLGDIANEFAQSFESDKADLVAVASRSLDKAQLFAKKYNVPKAYGDYDEMYADEEIDVIYVATPNSVHASNMIDILNAGKHILCEKAITMNAKELDTVLDLAEKKNLIVAEAMTIFHMPVYKQIKERVKSGEFGALKMATSYFGSLKEDDPTNRFFNPDLGGGALLDIGVYALSFVQYFLEADIDEFTTIVKPFETGVDEMSTISYSTTEGTLASVTLSFRGKLPKQGVVVCENAYITFMNYPRADEAVITYPDGELEVVRVGDTARGLTYEVENISEMLLTGEDLSEIEITKRVNKIMDKTARAWGMDWVF